MRPTAFVRVHPELSFAVTNPSLTRVVKGCARRHHFDTPSTIVPISLVRRSRAVDVTDAGKPREQAGEVDATSATCGDSKVPAVKKREETSAAALVGNTTEVVDESSVNAAKFPSRLPE